MKSRALRLPPALASIFPDPSAAVQLYREWRAKTRPMVLRPYVDLHSRWRLAARFLVPAGLGLICLVYGFFFAITAPFLIVPMAAPVAVLGLLSIWALPENNAVPTKPMELFFSALLIGLILWPNYLALTLPGLPWITMIRLTGFPMAFFLLLNLSMSPEFRSKIFQASQGAPLMLRLLLIFSANTLVSLPFSHGIGVSVNEIILVQLNWTSVFLVSLYVFGTSGRTERYVGLLMMLAVPIAVLTTIEFAEQHVLWASHVPSFLRVEDPSAQRALAGAVRGATGQYRAKATFSTALGLAEYMSLMTPFAMHWAVGRYPLVLRLVGLAMLPTIYVVVRMTDARLGILGYLVSILAYLLIWSIVRWRQRMSDLISAAIVYAYPAAFLAILAASMFVHKIHVLIFGSGAQAASNEHRSDQFRMAFPALLKNPLGHGGGQGGGAMGYGAGDFIAIDSYYILVALDYGVIGLVVYIAMFVIVIASAISTMLRFADTEDREVAMLLPLAACLTAFLLIRGVFGQPDIHPMIFTILGMVVGLVARTRGKLGGPRGASGPQSGKRLVMDRARSKVSPA